MSDKGFYLSGEEVADKPYHYRTAGLEGIFLLNGYEIEEHDGERHVSITDVDGLHQAIGRHIVTQRKGITPKEIRFLRNTLDLTQAELAARLGNNSQSVARWEKGECEIPGSAEKLLRVIFLASGASEDELELLRDLVINKLCELDTKDEEKGNHAQFRLFDHWLEKKSGQNAA